MARRPLKRAAAASTASSPAARIVGLDALRGVALVAMAAYHFCFDLRWFGLAHWDFEHDLRWVAARSLILGSFLLIAGASLVLASQRADAVRVFVRHWLRIALAALLVTVASYAAFPQTFIRFGVLHAIAVTLVLALPLVPRPRTAFMIGILVVVAGIVVADARFDAPMLHWIGFMTHRPATEDYVPLFPWSGVLLAGIPLGHALLRRGPGALARVARLPSLVPLLGRHSLLVYLVHQPVLIALLWLVTRR
ncbi:MAG TPA: heparan-alpha-glucosaminide N-acetyltransferase [Casimicrobiaceae bacterium]|nr:heparan-alpha-glucosaminide N-acetyltransferase [Casimicrobiaceae bacterium]